MKRVVFLIITCVFLFSAMAHAGVVFSDNFDSGARPEWGNEIGEWFASGGVYDSTHPHNEPPAHSSVTSLPNLTDFTVEVDILSLCDGGIFLRSQECEDGYIEGVALITGGGGHTYNGLYWHTVDCSGWGPGLNSVHIPGLQGSDIHLKIVVKGDTYSAYLNYDSAPITTLTTDRYSSGKVALYDYSGQTFDNVTISVGCEGDFDMDGDVDGSDLAVFAADFGRTDCEGSIDPCEGDFDRDGVVDGTDLAVFAADFGRTDCLY